MKFARIVAMCAALGLCGITYAAPVINTNRQRISLTLRGGDFVVNGNNNSIRLRGKCNTLTVNGNGNTITTDTLVLVRTNGNRNKVTWKNGARIENQGSYNRLSRIR